MCPFRFQHRLWVALLFRTEQNQTSVTKLKANPTGGWVLINCLELIYNPCPTGQLSALPIMSYRPQAPTPSQSSSGRSWSLDRLSKASYLSLASIKTALPLYETFDSNDSRKLDSPASMSNPSPTLYSPVDSDTTWDWNSGSPATESEPRTSTPVSPIQSSGNE